MHVLPEARSWWAEAMHQEVLGIENDYAAMRWALGCVLASYAERLKAAKDCTRYVNVAPNVNGLAPQLRFKDIAVDAIRYWESRRIIYNAVLIAIAAGWVVVTWPHFRPAFSLQSILPVLILFAAMNACYCLAYVPDIAMQHSSLRAIWQRRRWILWLLGTAFAMVLWYYWIADEIYPSLHG